VAIIHRTTMSPSKLQLLSSWLPRQPWYVGPAAPDLSRAGGFRLDDPAGEVGVEFLIVNAVSASLGVTYNVPLTYRGAPVPAVEGALVGTAEHGVLGPRWIYDGPSDPIFRDELVKLLCGLTLPQHASRSERADENVVVSPTADRDAAATASVVRVLIGGVPEASPSVSTVWTAPDGELVSGPVVIGPSGQSAACDLRRAPAVASVQRVGKSSVR
jgi:hypothetical protein